MKSRQHSSCSAEAKRVYASQRLSWWMGQALGLRDDEKRPDIDRDVNHWAMTIECAGEY